MLQKLMKLDAFHGLLNFGLNSSVLQGLYDFSGVIKSL